jgi:hypothetical protein
MHQFTKNFACLRFVDFMERNGTELITDILDEGDGLALYE